MVICQKSKIGDWIEHFNLNYPQQFHVLDLTDKHLYTGFWEYLKLSASLPIIGVINYELTFRRKELAELEDLIRNLVGNAFFLPKLISLRLKLMKQIGEKLLVEI